MYPWVRMPTSWIRDKEVLGLKLFSTGDNGPSIAALLLYIAIAHEVNGRDPKLPAADNTALLTYLDFMNVTGLSRAMISRGIRKLEEAGLVGKASNRRNSVYKLMGNSLTGGWGKLPKSHLVDNKLLDKLTHRNRNELNALKMYLLFIAFRHNQMNFALISYPKITEYTGIPTHHIRPGLSLLINLTLIHIDRDKEIEGKKGNPPSQYRISGIDPYRHKGTQREGSPPDVGTPET